MKRNKGFSFVEVLVSSSIILTLVTTAIPILSIVKRESLILSERRTIANYLHDDLQTFLWEGKEPYKSYDKRVNHTVVRFNFSAENEYVKGCAIWTNVRESEDEICFYGIANE